MSQKQPSELNVIGEAIIIAVVFLIAGSFAFLTTVWIAG
jgi:hypothetical protein